MFKIGDKAKGFKFDGEAYPLIGWDDEMNNVVGVVGEVSYVGDGSYGVHFKDSGVDWGYPGDLWYLGKVEKTQPFNVGDKVTSSFQVGDRVKFKKSSIGSGMIDATEDDVFNISHVAPSSKDVWIEEHLGWWSTEHIEHVKESAMNNTEDQEIKLEGSQIDWQVGQEVWCLIFGKGVVHSIDTIETDYPVEAEFSGETRWYTKDGKYYGDHHRTLFFSEPKIIAEKFPPKKPFVPKLKKGDVIIYRQRGSSCSYVGVVDYEDHDSVALEDSDVSMYKHAFEFHKLGEEIKFS